MFMRRSGTGGYFQEGCTSALHRHRGSFLWLDRRKSLDYILNETSAKERREKDEMDRRSGQNIL